VFFHDFGCYFSHFYLLGGGSIFGAIFANSTLTWKRLQRHRL